MQHCAETLTELGIPFEQRVVSAHRTPDLLFEYAGSAEERGLQVLIAGAGGAAHLPGMAAAKTVLSNCGVQTYSSTDDFALQGQVPTDQIDELLHFGVICRKPFAMQAYREFKHLERKLGFSIALAVGCLEFEVQCVSGSETPGNRQILSVKRVKRVVNRSVARITGIVVDWLQSSGLRPTLPLYRHHPATVVGHDDSLR